MVTQIKAFERAIKVSPCGRYLLVACRSRAQAEEKATTETELWASWALAMGCRSTRLVYGRGRNDYACVVATLAEGMLMTTGNNEPKRNGLGMTEQQMNLLGADYVRILEFLTEQRQQGKIVIITSNTTDICLHTNDLLKPSRAYWDANQFTGYNYLRSWRATWNDESRLNPQYERLKDLLARDGQIAGYQYELFRPDGAKCSYQTDYFLCRDYCGDEVRIGVSRVEDWQLLEPASV